LVSRGAAEHAEVDRNGAVNSRPLEIGLPRPAPPTKHERLHR
jgi:hypothetical protein